MRPGKWVSSDMPRKEDARLLMGKGQFVADMSPLPNIHHAAILRSPHAHARIKKIDVNKAGAMPGVVDILTGEDVVKLSEPLPVHSQIRQKYYPCAVDKVRFVGEPVAVVIARDRYVAEDALDLIEVDYEPLPCVTDPEEALDASAPILHNESGTNVAVHRLFRYGDVDDVFGKADRVVRERLVFPKYSPTPMETYSIIANYDVAAESVTTWCGFHGPYSMHAVMSKALRVPSHKLRIIVPPDVGGSFGVKITMYPYIVLIALASKKAGVPVKWIEDRLESLLASSSGVDRVAYMELGTRNDGTFVALKMKFIDNVGAYIRAPEPGCLLRPLGNITSAYNIKDVEMEGYAVVTNKSLTGPTRGYACQHLYFCIERVVDQAARVLGIDPAEIRRRNLLQPEQLPYKTPSGGVYDAGNYPAAFAKTLELADYDKLRKLQQEAKSKGRYLGIGLAIGIDPSTSNMGYIQAARSAEERKKERPLSGCAQATTIYVDHGGNVCVELSSCAHGQGHETVAAQIVSDEYGLAPEDVVVAGGMDTNTRAWTISSGAYSSRFAAVGSSSVAMAARKLKKKMVQIAAHLMKTSPDKVEMQNGEFVCSGDPNRKVTLRAVASAAYWNTKSLPKGMEPGLTATYFYDIEGTDPVDENDRVNSSGAYGFTSDLAVVEINPETYQIRLIKYISVHDAGTILHPGIAEGQVMGSIMHGIGGALYEELKYNDDGQFLAGTFMDYLVPTAMEAPEMVVDHVQTPSPLTALGAKGIGEASSQTAPVAVANAVEDALFELGVKITTLPLSSSFIWELVEDAKRSLGKELA